MCSVTASVPRCHVCCWLAVVVEGCVDGIGMRCLGWEEGNDWDYAVLH